MRNHITSSDGRQALLLTGSVLALAMSLPGVALAQAVGDGDPTTTQDVPSNNDDGNVSDGSDLPTEGVIITGIRQRLENSAAIKRDADTFVDAVTAEDIGALPDRSVNETLQRIPGVAINRFQGQDDPDHFSVEGSNVVIRGLTYVRSEFNGRDAFSVNTGRSLGFNDVSPELLASVVVFKNSTADRIEGGIAGLVDLRTRKAFDNRKLIVAGTLEGQYGDIREKLGYNGSLLLANTFSTPIGDFGALVSYGRSELYSTAFGTQISDFTYRPEFSTGDQLNFVPRGGGTKSQDFDRGRQTFDASLQFESIDERAKITLEYIRATSQQLWGEKVIEADLGNSADSQPGGTDFVFDNNGLLTSGRLINGAPDIQSFITREQDTKTRTQDYSINAELHPTDRLTVVLDAQYAKAHSDQIDMSVFGAVNPLFTAISPADGTIPNVLQVNADGSVATQLNDINSYYYRAAMDHVEENDGREYAFRADAKYDIDAAFLRAVHIGGRFSDREQTRKYTTYNWANISEVWNGGRTPFTDTGPLAATQFNFPDFQRGQVATPGPGYFLDNIVQNYRNGSLQDALLAARSSGGFWVPLDQRAGVIPGTPYLPGDINNSAEQTYAAYGRLDFGSDAIFGGSAAFSGNIGLRYVQTNFQTRGFITAPTAADVVNAPPGTVTQANAFAFAQARCAAVTDPSNTPGFCLLTPDRLQQLIGFADGSATPVALRNSFDDFLPSFNANLRFNDRFIVRAAVSRGMTRSDFGRSGFAVNLTPNAIGALSAADRANAPLLQSNIDPNGSGGGVPLNGVRAWNFDFGLEYYFKPAASVTLNLFYKDLKDIAANGSIVSNFTNSQGVTADAQVNQQVNIGKGNIKGFEFAYQQFYDFLPGALSGIGFEGNYTFIDPSTFPNQVTEARFQGLSLPLQNLSKHAFNVSALYEKYGISARASYNWRTRFLLIPRDAIYPFAPIYNREGGQLDASIFYALTPNIKLGLQGNNLLNQVTQTEAQTAFNLGDGNQPGPRAPRSYFQNDRRFSFGVRFNF